MKAYSKTIVLFPFLFLVVTQLYCLLPIDSFTISVKGEELKMEEVLSQYIQFASVSGNEKEAGEWLKNICVENGLFIKQMGDKDGNYNFSASLRPLSSKLPNIILLNHIDVVPAKDKSKWIYPPYSGVIADDQIWGRGSFDNKGHTIMHLFALLYFKYETGIRYIPYNVSLLAVSCEETMCSGGVAFVINNYLEELNPVVVLGEGPTELGSLLDYDKDIFGISIAHKRPIWLELSLKMKNSGHGSVTPDEYPIKEMATALERLTSAKPKAQFNELSIELSRYVGDTQKGLKKLMLKNPKYFGPILSNAICKEPELRALYTNTISVTGFRCNSNTLNVIPQEVIVTLDCRLLVNQDEAEFLDYIRNTLRNDDIKINVLKSGPMAGVSSQYTDFYYNLSAAIESVNPGSSVIPMYLPNFNDTGAFRAKGIQAYSTIPIKMNVDQLKCIHAANERIPVNALYKGANSYLTFFKYSMSDKMLLVDELAIK